MKKPMLYDYFGNKLGVLEAVLQAELGVLQHRITAAVECVRDLFREAARDHGKMKRRHRAYAAAFLGMLNNYVSLALNGYKELNDPLVRQSVHQFMQGIFS